MITPIPFKIQIVRLEKLLTVFAHGAKVIFKYNDIEFSGNFCDTSLFDPYNTIEAASHELYPGREFYIFAELDETSSYHYAKNLSSAIPSEIIEISELDWKIRGLTLGNAYEGSILVDCGIPVLAFSNDSINKKGEYGEWFGELKVWLSDEEDLT